MFIGVHEFYQNRSSTFYNQNAVLFMVSMFCTLTFVLLVERYNICILSTCRDLLKNVFIINVCLITILKYNEVHEYLHGMIGKLKSASAIISIYIVLYFVHFQHEV